MLAWKEEASEMQSHTSLLDSSSSTDLFRKDIAGHRATPIRLEDIQEVKIHGEAPDGAANNSAHQTPKRLISRQSLPAATSSHSQVAVRPQNDSEYILKDILLESEKKCMGGAVWHTTEYGLSENGFVHRKRVGTAKDLAAFDLRFVDVDRQPFGGSRDDTEGDKTITSVRIQKFGVDGRETTWLAKHEDPDVMMAWYTEMKRWKQNWHYTDWKQNLFVQIPRVPVDPERDFDLAHAVASERQLTGDNDPGVVFDRDFEENDEEETGRDSKLRFERPENHTPTE
ncbi:hypothetical protein RvY_18635 [Ramazzottius varieornatus]|uniref:Uncharacterized protein n=1 Tax=Ramazzottius varieornatus TaxID=947166 RepID=A0A1D1W6I9_RAMVA|nr:hypothetical protein RvY_18635 [Ramazzottius varieornatus]